jgi:hypothetical protein
MGLFVKFYNVFLRLLFILHNIFCFEIFIYLKKSMKYYFLNDKEFEYIY